MIKYHFPEYATPLEDISGLKLPWIQNLKDLNRAEAENISFAQKEFLEKSVGNPKTWFNLSYLKKIHLTMFGKVWSWAGRWRVSVTNIGVKPYLIPTKLFQLATEVLSWGDESFDLTFLERSVMIHHQLVSIHPFENGNGRFARLVADRYLVYYKQPHPIWPSEITTDSLERKHYIHSLKAADAGDYEPLMQLIEKFRKK